MADYIRIECINKTDRLNPHERIRSVGGVNPNGARWKLSLADAIVGIEAGRWQFYVERGGRQIGVIVATHNGHKYLKTIADSFQPDNLLALPECP